MGSIFAQLPDDLIELILIENDRRKYKEVVDQINSISTNYQRLSTRKTWMVISRQRKMQNPLVSYKFLSVSVQ